MEKELKKHIIEKTDKVLTNVIEENKMHSILLIISSIIMSISIVIFFIPVLMSLDKTLSIIIISIGLFLLTLGWSLKLTVWKRKNNKVIENTGMGFLVH